MACFHPWKPPESLGLPPTIKLTCGRCTGCRLRSSAEWATRITHEAKGHRYNTWLTLTFDDQHLPKRYNTGEINPTTRSPIYSGSLDKTLVPRFIRAIRKALSRKAGYTDLTISVEYRDHADMGLRPIPDIRYYYGGEYGEKYRRPHYHVCLFGIQFNDQKLIETTDAGFKLYDSKILKKLWPYGNSTLSELTWETAAYTARYVMKKVNGEKKKKHYEVINTDTGEIIELEPEFNAMSRRPGIGNRHYEKNYSDYYKGDQAAVRIRGKKTRTPRYYDKLHERKFPGQMRIIRMERKRQIIENPEKHSAPRLKAEEIITKARIKSLKGKL